eukprot:TRINITY_DN1182_c0_g1_i15.p4 TRINITY_DN1182_c0_g1~~TRINITY_DN1182_c0_g1_i15.p4  ORF type:complete len:107 (-),score=34.48 TRINITY_DN1182_c0_g1_i15:116-436(-)
MEERPRKVHSAQTLRPIPIPEDTEDFASNFNERDIAERAIVSHIFVDDAPKFLPISSTECLAQTAWKKVNCTEEAAVTTVSDDKTKAIREYTESFETFAANNLSKQ